MHIVQKNRTLLVTFLMNMAALGILLLLFYPRFESELDIIMQALLYGINGTYSSHLLFSNVVLGKVLDICMTGLPMIPWYIVFHYTMAFLSLNIITYITLKRNDSIMGRAVASVFLVFAGYECYICPNYMKTSAVLCAAAIYILFYRIENPKKGGITATVLAVISSMVCFEIFALTGMIGLIGLLVFVFTKSDKIVWVKRNCVFLLLILVVPLALEKFDAWDYASNQAWKASGESRDSLEKILGYGVPEYNDELKGELGINEQDYELLIQGIFTTVNEEAYEMVDGIARETRDIQLSSIGRFFRTVPIQAFKLGMFYCWIVLLILLFWSGQKKSRIILGIGLLLLTGSFFGLYIWNACEYPWIGTLVFLPICIFTMMGIEKISIAEKEYVWVYIGILGLILYNTFSASLLKTVRDPWELGRLAEQVEENDTTAYIFDINSVLQQYSVFSVYPKDMIQNKNIYMLNGVYHNVYGLESTMDLGALRKNSYENLYIQLRESIDPGRIIEALQNVYIGRQIQYEWVEKSGTTNIYELYVDEW